MTTSSFGTTVSQGVTRTTTTQIKSTCATITGCNFRDEEASTTIEACDLARRTVEPVVDAAGASDNIIKRAAPEPEWECDIAPHDAIIIPLEPLNDAHQAAIKRILDNRETALKARNIPSGYTEIRATGLGFTAFYFVNKLGLMAFDYFNSESVSQVHLVYRAGKPPSQIPDTSQPWPAAMRVSELTVEEDRREGDTMTLPDEDLAGTNETSMSLLKRDVEAFGSDGNWHLSMISTPGNIIFDIDDPSVGHEPDFFDHSVGKFYWRFKEPLGEGQTIYILEAGWFPSTKDSLEKSPRTLPRLTWAAQWQPPDRQRRHGSRVAHYAAGKEVGVARKAQVVLVPFRGDTDAQSLFRESVIGAIVEVANDLVGKPKDTAIINMSFGQHPGWAPDLEIWEIMTWLMQEMEDRLGVIFVAAAGNVPGPVNTYPALAARHLRGMHVVGAVDINSHVWKDRNGDGSSFGELVSAWAPGYDLPAPPGPFEDGRPIRGTSYAAPQVAGLVAYLRSLQDRYKEPDSMKYLVEYLQRRLQYNPSGDESLRPDRLIFNGLERSSACQPGASSSNPEKRQSGGGDSCPIPGTPGVPRGPPVKYQPGPPSPLCTEGCGKLCSGFYCVPSPSGVPPDFTPPAPGGDPPQPETPGIPGDPEQPETPGNPGIPGDPEQPETPGIPGDPEQPETPGGPQPPGEIETPYAGDECSSYLTTSTCNGSGGGTACVTQALCVPTPQCRPTYQIGGPPRCTDDEFPLCLVTSTVSRCILTGRDALPAPTSAPHVVFAETTTTTPSPPLPKKTNTDHDEHDAVAQNPEPPRGLVAAPPEAAAVARNLTDYQTLLPRQEECRPVIPDCQFILLCSVCAKIEQVPCLNSHIYAHGGLTSGTKVSASVAEDGVLVCEANLSCDFTDNNCSGMMDYDCGNGYHIDWHWNKIVLWSPKYENYFPMFLEQEDERLVGCMLDFIIKKFPGVCVVSEFRYLDGPCDGLMASNYASPPGIE